MTHIPTVEQINCLLMARLLHVVADFDPMKDCLTGEITEREFCEAMGMPGHETVEDAILACVPEDDPTDLHAVLRGAANTLEDRGGWPLFTADSTLQSHLILGIIEKPDPDLSDADRLIMIGDMVKRHIGALTMPENRRGGSVAILASVVGLAPDDEPIRLVGNAE